MADSSVIRISQLHDSELLELDRSPRNFSPTKPPTPTSPAAAATKTPAAIDKTLSSTANLVKLLPSGTVLAFQALSPSFTNKGSCLTSNKYLTAALISLCVLSCIFFSFTDSFTGRDGRLYYGVSTPGGFYVFNYDGSDEERSKVLGNLRRLRMRWIDYVHAFFSVLLFLTITFSDSGIQSCFFPAAGSNARQLLVNLPLGTGFLSSLLFMVFPTARRGIGYSDGPPRGHQ